MTGIIWPGVAGGGGYVSSSAAPRPFAWRPIRPGVAGGGGLVQSLSAAPPGLGGCGGPGPGALIGIRP